MAYFSNGEEFMEFNNEWCCKCIHGGETGLDCPVLELQERLNRQEANKVDSVLDIFIPLQDGVYRCKMFLRSKF